MAFVRRTKGIKIARRVKIVDILDNLNASRLSALNEKDMRRMKRYLAAVRELRNADGQARLLVSLARGQHIVEILSRRPIIPVRG